MTTEALNRIDASEFATQREVVAALEATARAAHGHDSLGDAVWRDLAHPAPDSVGFLIEPSAYLHLTRDGGDGESWTAGVVRLPERRDHEVTTILLEAAVAHVRARGGRSLRCWIFGATDADDARFTAAGFRVARTLFEMRAPLPVPYTARWPEGIEVRTFTPGRDEAEWLRVNNRAFASHTDQGGWTEATLGTRMAEPWFDPKLFLLAFDAEGLAGFNWLKPWPARDPDPALGEIYVIGIDPRAQGSGLGRALAIAGLGEVYSRGAEQAMLFCSADNTGALALYRSLGFVVHRTDRAYVYDLGPAAT